MNVVFNTNTEVGEFIFICTYINMRCIENAHVSLKA